MLHYLKSICALILVGGFVSGCTMKQTCDFTLEPTEPYHGQPFSVMTYNIRVGVGPSKYTPPTDTRQNLDAIAEAIRDSGADIILLQEIDRNSNRTSNLDQLAYLAEALQMESAWASTLDDERYEYGIGLLSAHPILVSEKIVLPRIDYLLTHPDAPEWYSEPRSLLVSDIQIGDQVLQVYNAHLGITLEERALQLNTISQLMQDRDQPDAIQIFGGDLNSEPDDQGLVFIRQHMKDAYHLGSDQYGLPTNISVVDRLTYPAIKPNRCIDYLFYSLELTCTNTEVLDDQLSDHLAVISAFN